jgi:hypothetical protein
LHLISDLAVLSVAIAAVLCPESSSRESSGWNGIVDVTSRKCTSGSVGMSGNGSSFASVSSFKPESVLAVVDDSQIGSLIGSIVSWNWDGIHDHRGSLDGF